MKFPRFTWFLGEEFLENCSLKQITDGLWPFGWLKRSLANRVLHWEQLIMGRERIVSLLVDCTNLLQQRPSPFLARWGCKEIGCFQCCYNWVGIYHEPCPVGRSSDSDPTFRKSTNRSESTTDSDEDDRILLFYIVDSKDFGWSSADPDKNDANVWNFEKVLCFLWTTSLSWWCGSYQM